MARDHETLSEEAESSLRRGMERSRRVVERYRARLLFLREAMQRQSVPQFAPGPRTGAQRR